MTYGITPQILAGGVLCDSCGFNFDPDNASVEHQIRKGMVCPADGCYNVISSDSLPVVVRKSESGLLDRGAAQDALWFHATRRENWMETLLSLPETDMPTIHVGSREAAVSRANGEYAASGTWYLYALRVRSNVCVSEAIFADENMCAPWRVGDLYAGYFPGYGAATRYVNAFESIGSISMVGDPRAFEVVDVVKLR